MAKLMIVDDQSFIRTVLREKIKSIPDLEIIEAGDGDSAIYTAMGQKPDLILLDIIMPRIDGLTILQELKTNPETKQIPIVVVSSHAEGGKQQKAMEMGAEEFVNKADIPTADFEAIVKKYIQ